MSGISTNTSKDGLTHPFCFDFHNTTIEIFYKLLLESINSNDTQIIEGIHHLFSQFLMRLKVNSVDIYALYIDTEYFEKILQLFKKNLFGEIYSPHLLEVIIQSLLISFKWSYKDSSKRTLAVLSYLKDSFSLKALETRNVYFKTPLLSNYLDILSNTVLDEESLKSFIELITIFSNNSINIIRQNNIELHRDILVYQNRYMLFFHSLFYSNLISDAHLCSLYFENLLRTSISLFSYILERNIKTEELISELYIFKVLPAIFISLHNYVSLVSNSLIISSLLNDFTSKLDDFNTILKVNLFLFLETRSIQ